MTTLDTLVFDACGTPIEDAALKGEMRSLMKEFPDFSYRILPQKGLIIRSENIPREAIAEAMESIGYGCVACEKTDFVYNPSGGCVDRDYVMSEMRLLMRNGSDKDYRLVPARALLIENNGVAADEVRNRVINRGYSAVALYRDHSAA
jgi:hypothetical protein